MDHDTSYPEPAFSRNYLNIHPSIMNNSSGSTLGVITLCTLCTEGLCVWLCHKTSLVWCLPELPFILRPSSHYFACVTMRPEVNVKACCNARIEKNFYACIATRVQIILYALPVTMRCKQNIVNQAIDIMNVMVNCYSLFLALICVPFCGCGI